MALLTLCSVLLLILVGAVVRVTGSGLGCPDWPTCWGQVIPPTDVSQVDLERIDLEKFRQKAERLGRDPASVDRAHLLQQFNPVHTWIEFLNRMTSLPVGLFSLLLLWPAWQATRDGRTYGIPPLVSALGALLLVLLNAWLGAQVVYSGLKPGIITLHLALAMLLVVLLSYLVWQGSGSPTRQVSRMVKTTIGALFVLSFLEGVMGSQVRELTDALALSHLGQDRSAWIPELEAHGLYLIHRSFSWLLLVLAAFAWWQAGAAALPRLIPSIILAIMLAQMVTGFILARVAIHPAAQVIHLFLASILLVTLTWWWCVSTRKGPAAKKISI